ncbi:MAG: 3-deoxy-manno-octulosonate cytidylyltransferase [Bacteroidales bacterium]|nr:3-deoxy-manno-octulosonate cytidylyltransferase [Bacteroidales bacterium]MDD3915407.1 3-deoxy-manno-octulosonate cytidylyltransferase [Bacteroidales bacterium]MDD4634967.1 3-deoxy-manno-octulosonate cytidylyltransferase [Bacteroidales bacterium]
MKIIGVIPARYQSSRFPGKPLADIMGKSMIRRVYEQAKKSKELSAVVIATDDERIMEHVLQFTDNVMMTSVNHSNGTERVMEVVDTLSNKNENYDIVVNIQGDEPLISPNAIDEVISILTENANADIATLINQSEISDIDDVNNVKVVIDNKGKALYFSRSPIPYYRSTGMRKTYNKHIGIYAFKIDVLKNIVLLEKTPLEIAESLEQLRWIENGYAVYVKYTDYKSIGVDVPEDIKKITKLLRDVDEKSLI